MRANQPYATKVAAMNQQASKGGSFQDVEALTQPLTGGKPPEPKPTVAPCVVDPFGSPRGFIKWFVPGLFVGLGGYIGSAGLHYASYNFVHQMDAWNKSDEQFNGSDLTFAKAIEMNYTSNRDPVERWLGPQEVIPMGILDKIAMLFPSLFFLLMLATQRVEVWTKVMVCTALLAATKGIIGAVTTVPDSSGWEICRVAHLGADGYAWLRQDHTFYEIVTVDFWWLRTYGHPLRYCSDMMFSGHTFFVTLYALGLYEVALIWTNNVAPKDELSSIGSEEHKETKLRRLASFTFKHSPSKKLHVAMDKWSPGAKATFRAVVLIFVSTLAIGQQCCEIYFVLLSHFHYTSDVLVALMFTFLFYSNGAISIFAKQWALRDLHFLTGGHLLPKFYLNKDDGRKQSVCKRWKDFCWPDKETRGKAQFSLKHWDYSSGVPVLREVEKRDQTNLCLCCGQCVWSRKGQIENPPYLVHRKCKNTNCKNLAAKDHSVYCRSCGTEFEHDSGLKDKALQNTWVSRGDIFVPVCCFPCCCLAGRQHIYSDQGVDSFRFLINGDNDPTNDIGDDVVEQMHMHEGISEVDAESIRLWMKQLRGHNVPEAELRKRTIQTQSISPWAYSYLQPAVTAYAAEKGPEFRKEKAKQCPNPNCKQLMPNLPEYKHCVTCRVELPANENEMKTWGEYLDEV